MNNNNLPAWWDREKWKKKIEEDPRQRGILLAKILDLAMIQAKDEMDYLYHWLERTIESKQMAQFYSIGSLVKKEMEGIK